MTRLDGRMHVHLVNTAGPHENQNVYAFDEIPVVGPLDVALRLPEPPTRIVRQPAGVALPFTMRNGRAVVTIPRLEIHDVLVVEQAVLGTRAQSARSEAGREAASR